MAPEPVRGNNEGSLCPDASGETSDRYEAARRHPPAPQPGYHPESLRSHPSKPHRVPLWILKVISFSRGKAHYMPPSDTRRPPSGTQHTALRAPPPPCRPWSSYTWCRPDPTARRGRGIKHLLCPPSSQVPECLANCPKPNARARPRHLLPSGGNIWRGSRGSLLGWGGDAGGPWIQPRASRKASWRRCLRRRLQREEAGPEPFGEGASKA